MKKKEINIWIDKEAHQRLLDGFVTQAQVFLANHDVANTVPAKIILTIPEEKIEITESDLYEAFTFTFQDAYHGNYKVMAGKLFGKDAG